MVGEDPEEGELGEESEGGGEQPSSPCEGCSSYVCGEYPEREEDDSEEEEDSGESIHDGRDGRPLPFVNLEMGGEGSFLVVIHDGGL